ncbi:MAG: ATP-binding protein [Actinobacteria bacterium]|nr:ATP-binding protein [Actinomycetota bacterium]
MDELLLQNPWWEDKKNILNDVHIKKLKGCKYIFEPEMFKSSDLDKDAVYTLRGARQVGKTTLVKLIIKKLLGENINPRNIFYYSMDLVKDDKELFGIFLSWYQTVKEDSRRKYIFFDEATFVNNWEKSIKHIVDTVGLEKKTFILTGSSAIDLRKGSERLPGRRGVSNPDKLLLPLSFKEFCNLTGLKISLELENNNISIDTIKKNIPELKIYQSELEFFLDKYLVCGGFLESINSFFRNNIIGEETFERYISVLFSEIEKVKKSRVTAKNILASIIDSLSSTVSWNRLAKKSGNISTNTVIDYVNVFSDSFILYYIEYFNMHKFAGNPAKEKKLYFFDPFYYQITSRIINLPYLKISRSCIIESLIGAHLVRNFEKGIYQGFSNIEKIFYWESSKDKEIDFILNRPGNDILPLEVKYQNIINPIDYITIKNSFTGGIVVSKNTFSVEENIIILPASSLLYLLN